MVWYGTSITQGGCTTRPGLAASNILSRLLDREVVNQGYSGSGKGEPEIAEMLANRDAQSGESATKKRGGRPKKTTEDK